MCGKNLDVGLSECLVQELEVFGSVRTLKSYMI